MEFANIIDSKVKCTKEADVFAREVTLENPKLLENIHKTMCLISEAKSKLPFIHITSIAIRDADGIIHETGFLDSIKRLGFKARHTNVGAFIKRGEKPNLAEPDYFIENPKEFIKEVRLLVKRYAYHGLRTNKQVLGETEGGKGVPVMVLIDGNIKVEHGSDYDNHYTLSDNAEPQQIIGEVNLENHIDTNSAKEVGYIVESILGNISSFYQPN